MAEYLGFPVCAFLLIGVAGWYLFNPARRSIVKLGVLTGAVHFAVVLAICVVGWTSALVIGGGGTLFAYLLFKGMDVPLSLGYDIFASTADAILLSELPKIIFYFGILGSMQYTVFGAVFGALLILLMKVSLPGVGKKTSRVES